MAVRARKVVLWRGKVEDGPGALARVLASLDGADLEIVMGYVEHGGHNQAVIEVFPIAGRKLRAAAQAVGLRPSTTPTLLVTGDGRASVRSIANALAEAGISIAFLVALTGAPRSSALLGFASEASARAAARLIRKTAQGGYR